MNNALSQQSSPDYFSASEADEPKYSELSQNLRDGKWNVIRLLNDVTFIRSDVIVANMVEKFVKQKPFIDLIQTEVGYFCPLSLKTKHIGTAKR